VSVIEAQLREADGGQRLEELAKQADLAHYRELLHGAIAGAEELRSHFAPHLDRSRGFAVAH
jgi:hypothetical protein